MHPILDRFNLLDGSTKFLPVANFTAHKGTFFDKTSTGLVEKLNIESTCLVA
jgi:hypothetical protein